MFKILDFTEATHTASIVNIATNILVISVFLTGAILIIRDVKRSRLNNNRDICNKNVIEIISISIISLVIIAGACTICNEFLINPVSASTDHYSFEISNNKYISLHPTQSRDVRMEFDTSDLTVNRDNKTRVNMLEIVSETEDRFICEAKSQSKSETIELMKNEHRFVRK